ncbi:ABC transporter substrate-binding protein [Pseudonocardia sp. DSM 110487]|uniref:ABC transporter substrate-binding protein n=1 Tax=Pseudonocardia sp. DSM 110487 TaxID=2865833 RepID=UPI001C69C27E|nr:ABC transporter substrate-binding protein [Pseudonocardia sp. DSM 110487]QYN38363.1 ABC transporter substrate-binding protein [Pseudonocardia sp. DSM 110487]
MKARAPKVRNLCATLAAALLISACGAGGRPQEGGGTEPQVGVTATSVKVGAHFPLTGVAAPGYSEIPTGTKAYFDFVNAAGGVHGRQIEYVFRDDAYNPTQTSQVVNELVLQDQVFAITGGLGTPTHSAVLDYLNSEGVPDLFVSSGSLLWDQPQENPMTFGWQPDYEIEAKIIGQYVAQNFPQARVGLFLQDDDLGRDAEIGARRYLESQIVAAERYTPGNTDVAPQIAALQAAGADLVIGFNVPSYTALSQLQSLRLNYRPQWIYSNIGSDPALVGSLLARFSEGAVTDAGLLEGVLTTEYLPGVDNPDNPWMQLFQRVWDAHGGEGELTNYRVYGMAEAYTFVQALQAAGPNPTREGIVDAVERSGATFEGPWAAPFRYSAERHAGISGVQVTRITGGTTQNLTPVLVTDNGDAPITEATEEPAQPPADGIPDVQPVS